VAEKQLAWIWYEDITSLSPHATIMTKTEECFIKTASQSCVFLFFYASLIKIADSATYVPQACRHCVLMYTRESWQWVSGSRVSGSNGSNGSNGSRNMVGHVAHVIHWLVTI